MATLLLEDLPPDLLRQLQQASPPVQSVTPPVTPSVMPSRASLDQLLTLCPDNASRMVAIPPVRGEPVTDTSPEYRGR